VDPCPGACGLNAECHVVNHGPSCSCLPGYIGNPLSACSLPPAARKLLPLSYIKSYVTECLPLLIICIEMFHLID
jgi:hypothetical protein